MSDEQQRIIASVFSRRNAHGSLDETYVSHVKIWEDADGAGRKLRYILLSQASSGQGYIHKSKLNSNGSFSVGKTWMLHELRAIQVLNPLAFNISLARTYRWQTDDPVDQLNFLHAVIRLFHMVTSNSQPLRLEGMTEPEPVSSGPRLDDSRHAPSDRRNEPAVHKVREDGYVSRPDIPANPRTVLHHDRIRDSGPNPQRTPSPSIPVSQTAQVIQQPGVRHRQSDTDLANVNVPSVSLHAVPTQESGSKDITQQASLLQSPAESRTASPSPSPSAGSRQQLTNAGANSQPNVPPSRRDPAARISFFDAANQAVVERLLAANTFLPSEIEGEDESTHGTMSNVEEMLEGYDWASDDVIGRKNVRGAVDLIQARLTDELIALENANIHSFLETDNRVLSVVKYMDEALAELDNMDGIVSSYKIHLNAVSEDILYIQSQNRGLQVQTQNLKVILSEIEKLFQTVNVSQEALVTLTQESLEKAKSIGRLEEAAAELYKALLAGRDTDMAATMERLQEYKTYNGQFCKRLHDFLSVMFAAQVKLSLGETNGLDRSKDKARPVVIPHDDIEVYLGRYSGLMLYLKEMDEQIYGKLCSAYFSTANELHSSQVKELLLQYLSLIRRLNEEDQDQGFTTFSTSTPSRSTTLRRAGTLIKSPAERNKEKDKQGSASLRGFEAFGYALEQIAKLVYRENDFVIDFLQINDAGLAFADYMGLDNYFRREAARSAGLGQATVKLIRGAMDLIFGFLPAELKSWFDNALAKETVEVVGMLAAVERFAVDAEERNNQYFQQLLSKQHTRLKSIFDRHVVDQLKGIEQTKLTSKKRRGVASFVKYFPVYISRVESQLLGADDLEIRTNVDAAYERIVQTMFDSLRQMAKLEGEVEDKGQLNYHVILIGKYPICPSEISSLEIGSVQSFVKGAEAIYDENLSAYIKIVIRRPFSRIIDFFEGIERLLKTKSPSEIGNNSSYNKQALRKVVKEYNARDVRKHIDALHKRIEKHFTEASEKATMEDSGIIAPGPVMVGVWKACEEEVTRITDLFSKRINECYEGSGVTLEYSITDVDSAFRRQRSPS
ncbi:Exocyst complex component Sec3 domain containing protein [Amanita muscaria]